MQAANGDCAPHDQSAADLIKQLTEQTKTPARQEIELTKARHRHGLAANADAVKQRIGAAQGTDARASQAPAERAQELDGP